MTKGENVRSREGLAGTGEIIRDDGFVSHFRGHGPLLQPLDCAYVVGAGHALDMNSELVEPALFMSPLLMHVAMLRRQRDFLRSLTCVRDDKRGERAEAEKSLQERAKLFVMMDL
jgi:hypothetical protein